MGPHARPTTRHLDDGGLEVEVDGKRVVVLLREARQREPRGLGHGAHFARAQRRAQRLRQRRQRRLALVHLVRGRGP